MFFKKLELQGFKSFAYKTEFIFEPGITAIVGPNGCGKTNLQDAIKWVLGDQSAKSLRGCKMEDIIFNGTVDKEPVNLAEVSLTLSNYSKILPIDYEEVTISRRLYRSGESEYLLNKTPVRLKDITELLAGTGIGIDNYFMMEQGRIDLILSSRPEERRSIFEEASGIIKYKAKKKEALIKLEHTQTNLLRINDIIAEVERQIRTIERQAQKARRYQNHFDRLKDLEVKLSSIELGDLQTRYNEMQNQIEKGRESEIRLSQDLRTLFENLRQIRQRLEDLDQKISGVKSEILDADSAIFKNNERIKLDKERIQSLEQDISNLKLQIESSTAKAANLKKQQDELTAQKQSLFKDKDQKEKLLNEKEGALSSVWGLISQADNTIKQCRRDLLENTNQHLKVKNELTRLGTDIATKQARLKRLGVEKENTQNELNQAEEKLKEAESKVASRIQDVNAMCGQIDSLQSGLKTAIEKIEGARKASDTIQEEYTVLKSRFELLKEIAARHEGFQEGVKNLLQESNRDKEWFRSICGVLADLITVREDYQQCIEAALEQDIQSIVIENQESAEKIIEYLKQYAGGRVRMLILGLGNGQSKTNSGLLSKFNFIRAKEQELPAHPGLLGKAIDFVSADSKYEGVLAGLLCSTWIAKDLKSALEIFQNNKSVRLVTLDGEIVQEGCIVAGKGKAEQERLSLIGRGAKLEKMKKQILKLQEEIDVLKKTSHELSQRQKALQEELGPLQEAFREKEIELANLQSYKETIESGKARFDDEYSIICLESGDIEEELKNLKAKEETLVSAAEELKKTLQQLDRLIIENQDLIKSKSEEKEGLIVEIAKLKTEFSMLSIREKNLLDSLNVVSQALQTEETAICSSTRGIGDSQAKIEGLHTQIRQLCNDVDASLKKKDLLAKDIEALIDERKEMAAEIINKEETQERLQKQLQDIKSQIYSVEVKSTEVSFQQERLKDRISQTYKIDLGSYKLFIQKEETGLSQELPQDFNVDQARSEIEELKARLDSIGAVNLAAVDEQKELQERFDFLVNQRDDLLKARDSLLAAIAKINKTTKAMFIQTFQKIQVEFKNFFKLMFGGGEAELFLLDDSDVLESGIEIVVRPPGKRLQNISLLSGGEKAMTALALLFAVFRVKPSPFCIMDEMDAALDEANIDRFTRVLGEFTKDSQFIIITHNKKTITMADVMYGITMEESGISKVVSVRFAERKEEEAVAV